MFGIRFVKFEPNDFVFVIKKGKIHKQGQALSFWYYGPSTSFIKLPVGSMAAPFIFEELTSDYQNVTVQGEVIYRISDPVKIKDQINFAISTRSLQYLSEDPEQLNQKIVNITKTITKREMENLSLKAALKATDRIRSNIATNIQSDEYLLSLGVEVTNVSILKISPNQETSRALEAETREIILRESDDAIYIRRNSSVEQERKIKENELNTEIAIETKKRQIRETQVDAERAIKEKERLLIAEEMQFKILQEKENAELTELTVKNRKVEADSKTYALESVMRVFSTMNPEILKTLSQTGMRPEQLIASAFDGLSKNAEKIGELNISPDLLRSLMEKKL